MGNRSYLNLKNSVQLFEANNSLPLFWFLGVTFEQISDVQVGFLKVREYLESYVEGVTDAEQFQQALEQLMLENQVGYLEMPIGDYLAQLKKNRDYIALVYPELLAIYQKFIQLISAEMTLMSKAVIEMNFIETLNFYEDILDFYQELIQLQRAIEEKQPTTWVYVEDPVGSLLGFDDYSNHHQQGLITETDYQELAALYQPKEVTEVHTGKSGGVTAFFQKLFKR